MNQFGFTPFTESTANDFQKTVIQMLKMFESDPFKGVEAGISLIVSIIENTVEDTEDREYIYDSIIEVFETKGWAVDFSSAPHC
jgi:hypothetical protein